MAVSGRLRKALFTVNRGLRKIREALFTVNRGLQKIREALFTVNRGYIFTANRALRGLPKGLITVDRVLGPNIQDNSLIGRAVYDAQRIFSLRWEATQSRR